MVASNSAPPPLQAQPAILQPDQPPAINPAPPLPPDTATRKITVFRSVKSDQYDVPQEVQ
jgi:hypothetical protein